MSGYLAPFGEIIAWQDRDCFDKLKLQYRLTSPLSPAILEQFVDATIKLHRFSSFVPRGRDLFKITKPSVFWADGIVGDRKLTVAFNGSPRDWPKDIVDDFGRRLIALGYSAITYQRTEPSGCAACAVRFLKKCHGGAEHPGSIYDPL